MAGGTGNDTYVVDNEADEVTELENERHRHGQVVDRLHLANPAGANIENPDPTGTEDRPGTGNGLNNIITGNSGAQYAQRPERKRHDPRRRR